MITRNSNKSNVLSAGATTVPNIIGLRIPKENAEDGNKRARKSQGNERLLKI